MLCHYCHERQKLNKEDHCGEQECHNLSLANRRRQYGRKTQKIVDRVPEKSRPIDPDSNQWQTRLEFLEIFYEEQEQKPEPERLTIRDIKSQLDALFGPVITEGK